MDWKAPISPVTGKRLHGPVTACAADLPGVVRLANQVFRPAPRPGDMGQEFPVLLGPDNLDNLYVFGDGEQVVAHAGVLRQRIRTCGMEIPVACVGGVCTHSDYRKAGLAGQLMDVAIGRSIEQGDVLMPISGKRTLYTSRGAQSIGPQVRFSIPLIGCDGGSTGLFAISAYEPGDWEELAALAGTEHAHYVWASRDAGMLDAICRLGGICLLARRKTGEVAAALLFCIGHPMYNSSTGPGRVVQFIGDVTAIPSLMGLIGSSGVAALDWTVLTSAQPQVAQVLRSLGATGAASVTGWTVLILNLAELVERVAAPAARAGIEIACEDGKLVVAAQGKLVRLAQAQQQVEVLFGGSATWSGDLATMPAEFRTACSAALPIPLPDYGINYV